MAQSHHADDRPVSILAEYPGQLRGVPEEDQSPDPGKFLEILRRRKWVVLVLIVIIFSLSVVTAFSLPVVYRSTATISIEQQEIPSDLVRSTVSSYADERIQQITQRVLTTDYAIAIIEGFNLYSDQRGELSLYVLAARMRDDLTVEMIKAGVRDPRSGRTRDTTIAFKISFDGRSPTEAQNVTNELASLYLKENLETRTQAATDTVRFLTAESDRLAAEINALETNIASFKKTNMGRLPEQLDLSLELMNRIDQSLLETERRLRSLEERKIVLKAAMAQINAISGPTAQGVDGAASADQRLQDLRIQYVGLSAVYAAGHPDVVRLRREIEALEREVTTGDNVTALQTQLESRKAKLTVAMERYLPQHPDVKRLEREVTSLVAELKAVSAAGTEASSRTSQVEDPAYIDLDAQRQVADSEQRTLRAQQVELRNKYAVYENRISQMPEIERQYSLLVRDRENLIARYEEIKSKLIGARTAEVLEKDRKGERFTLIEPANLPSKPFKPNRPKILALGLMGSFVGALGMTILTEMLFERVHGPQGVKILLGRAPLGIIPYIENSQDRRRRRFKRWAIALSFLVMLAVGAISFHLWIMPLDLLWAGMQTFLDGS